MTIMQCSIEVAAANGLFIRFNIQTQTISGTPTPKNIKTMSHRGRAPSQLSLVARSLEQSDYFYAPENYMWSLALRISVRILFMHHSVFNLDTAKSVLFSSPPADKV
jgi:hypothetical protein